MKIVTKAEILKEGKIPGDWLSYDFYIRTETKKETGYIPIKDLELQRYLNRNVSAI